MTCLKWITPQRMKKYAKISVGPVLLIRVPVSFYSAQEEKAVHLSKKWVVTVACVMSGINMVWVISIFVLKGLPNKDKFQKSNGNKGIRNKGYRCYPEDP